MYMFFLLKNHLFWFRCLYMLLWGKFVLYKYVTCWLVTVSRKDKAGLFFNKLWGGSGRQVARGQQEPLTALSLRQEGVCILTGLGFNDFETSGKAKWDACANMKVWLFETTPCFTGTIASFNINTNAWVAR